MKDMEHAGLCIMKDDGTGYFDRFRGRIMFPLRDDNGNVVGFSGRILSGSKQEAKYLNSPETPIFEKVTFCTIFIMHVLTSGNRVK